MMIPPAGGGNRRWPGRLYGQRTRNWGPTRIAANCSLHWLETPRNDERDDAGDDPVQVSSGKTAAEWPSRGGSSGRSTKG